MWGDEGKAKIIQYLSREYDYVVRYQGGANAGHTIYLEDGQKFVFHLVPAGILHPGKKAYLGSGMVVDPEAFLEEIDSLAFVGKTLKNRVKISHRAHVVLPFHKFLDDLLESRKGKQTIGTTKKGIGPCYVDKVARVGIRFHDLVYPSQLGAKIENLLSLHPLPRGTIRKQKILNLAFLRKMMKKLRPYIYPVEEELARAYRDGKKILFEGAQGVLLDGNFGTYPYVTSSSVLPGGALSASGLPPSAVKKIYGVFKAYVTRVGKGPFPTEIKGKEGRLLRMRGGEFGATTGRPRRVGHQDLVALNHAVQNSGVTDLIMTKADILDDQKTIKMATSYGIGKKSVIDFPASIYELERSRPVLRSMPGWKKSINGQRLAPNLLKYARYIKSYTGVPVSYISYGPEEKSIKKC